jgi:FHS family L-fucose permease-like MFS transporter
MDSAITAPAPPGDGPKRTSVDGRFITQGYELGFVVITSLFMLWAIANNFNDILIRQLQKALALDRAQAGFIQFAFYLGYFFMALPAGLVARRFGYRVGIIVGLLLYAGGALLFYPASYMGRYGPFCWRCSCWLRAPPFWRPAPTPISPASETPAAPRSG